MNLAIRGLDFNLGESHGDTFSADKHPNLKADYIFMNPPFGAQSEWPRDELMKDPRWVYSIPPDSAGAKPWAFAGMLGKTPRRRLGSRRTSDERLMFGAVITYIRQR